MHRWRGHQIKNKRGKEREKYIERATNAMMGANSQPTSINMGGKTFVD